MQAGERPGKEARICASSLKPAHFLWLSPYLRAPFKGSGGTLGETWIQGQIKVNSI